jgi:hypothetical protein
LVAAGLSSGQACLAGELRVSRRSSWTLSPSSSQPLAPSPLWSPPLLAPEKKVGLGL